MRVCFKIINLKLFAIFITIIFLLVFKINNYSNTCVGNSNHTNEIVDISNTLNNNENIIYNQEWILEIPSINLKADIAEGTSSEILNNYIGHFEETSKQNGNIVLAAHNRGYPVNYFENLKELEIGDEIYYSYNGIKNIYKVNSQNIIKDTNVEILENTEENIITLITCVENQPETRRCIQGIKIN